MRGQLQASAVRLGTTPGRGRFAVWADARVRKRQSEQTREAVLTAALRGEQRRALRLRSGRPSVALRRLPY